MNLMRRAIVRASGALALVIWAAAGHAATFTVSKTADTNDGTCNADCSLREAIVAANATPAADTIAFAIPGAGPHTISPSTFLPGIVAPLTIDGYTQPGSVQNTALNGTNAVLRIVLNGGLAAGGTTGLSFSDTASGSTVAGLVINGFRANAGNGHGIGSSDTGLVVRGCFIGTNVGGTAAVPNEGAGILGRAARIGGTQPADVNIISGNGGNGISSSMDVIVQGNLIGVAANGTAAIGNGSSGIVLNGGLDALIGGSVGNTIAFNGSDGVRLIGSTTRVAVLSNSIFSNDGLGIDLDPNGPTANDPLDSDTGVNDRQNAPVLTLAAVLAEIGPTSELKLIGYLDSIPNTSFQIEFFVSAAADPGGFGEGQRLVAVHTVTTDAEGLATIRISPDEFDVFVSAGAVMSATATRMEGTSAVETSEFSNALALVPAVPVTNTAETGAGSLRQAIVDANSDADLDAIVFDFTTAGPRTFAPLTELPPITQPAIIDGYSHISSRFNSRRDGGSNAALRIELSGASAPVGADGLTVAAPGSAVRGLAVHGFRGGGASSGGNGIMADGSDVEIRGNFIGTSLDGLSDLGNDGIGIDTGVDSVVGGPAPPDRNVIGGNGGFAIAFGSRGNVIQGNLIGRSADLSVGLGNEVGISARGGGAVDARIGGRAPGEGNLIASNRSDAVQLNLGGSGNTVAGNRLFNNSGLAVDLLANGPSQNDADDADTGANDGQNFPVLSLAQSDGVATTVIGALDRPATPAGSLNYTIDVYASTACDPSGNGEGEFYVGGATAAVGVDDALVVVVQGSPPAGANVITVTATDAAGSTSEFSACEPLAASTVLFADSFE